MDLAQRFGQLKQISKKMCSYQLVDQMNGFIIQNVNNETNKFIVFHKQYRFTGKNYEIMDRKKCISDETQPNFVQVKIAPHSHFTLLVKMIEGGDNCMLNDFKFE